ncbi:MFS transporter [Cellulomonas sp. SLBN-39]|uniref:MFS transporter n=1 Tax=Cellulomonas sp. SLBN-39 TaxID=2768446 RepID=UPI0011528CD7|nr:MFS transporter [Cellulomonas sp. SLBN-39]TQL02806.1 putative MFS family arabinose efflux permease [Cellulomonas sp. SLBN-39]
MTTAAPDRVAGAPSRTRHLPPWMREQVVLVCCLVATAQVTWGALVPALPEVGAAYGLSASLLGVVVAAFGVGRLLTNVPAGLLADRVGARALLLGGGAGLVVVTAATALADDLASLLVLRVLAGALGGTVVTVGLALLAARAPGDARGRVMATAQAAQLTGAAVGPVLGSAALGVGGVPGVFVAAALPVLVCTVVVVVRHDRAFWGRVQRTVPVPGGVGTGTGAGVARSALSRAALAAVVGANVAGAAVFVARFGGEQTLAPLLARDAGLDARGLGVAMAVVTIVSLALTPLVARALDAGWRRRVLVPAALVGAAAMVAYPLVGSPAAFAALVVVAGTCVSTAGIVPGVVLAERVAPERQGRATGVFRTVGDAGAVVGPLGLGALLDHAGPTVAAVALAAVVVAATAATALLVRPVVRRSPLG